MIPSHIETNRLLLRPFQPDDATEVLKYWQSDPGWERFNASVPQDFTVDDAVRFVDEMCSRDRHLSPNWAITLVDEVIGVVSVTFEQGHQIALIGYGVHGDYRGQGITIEATTAAINRAFAHIPSLTRFRAHTDADNTASIRVLEKLGFLHEGTFRQNQFVKGRYVDEAIFGLLREEWHQDPG